MNKREILEALYDLATVALNHMRELNLDFYEAMKISNLRDSLEVELNAK